MHIDVTQKTVTFWSPFPRWLPTLSQISSMNSAIGKFAI